MKKKLLSLLVISCLLMNTHMISYANENNDEVEPNVYEKREILIQQDSGDYLIERRELPKEQLKLTFEKSKDTNADQLKDKLFQSIMTETNTITSEADRIGLFSVADETSKRHIEEELAFEQSNLLKILMIVVVIIVIGLLFVIVPRLQQTQE